MKKAGEFLDRINKIYRIGRQGNLDRRNMKDMRGNFDGINGIFLGGERQGNFGWD
jgi:hypothetical protein